MGEKNSIIPWAIVIVLTFIVIYTSYPLFFAEIFQFNPFGNKFHDAFPSVKEMHFPNKIITYSINFENLPKDRARMTVSDYFWIYTLPEFREETQKDKIRRALKIIENSTDNLIEFQEVPYTENSTENLLFYWDICDSLDDEEYYVKGYGGIINSEGNKILSSEVAICLLDEFIAGEYYYLWSDYDCANPGLQIHEILHAMGFGHTYTTAEPIMNPIGEVSRTCRLKDLQEDTKSCLKHIYSNREVKGDCSNLNIYPYNISSEGKTLQEDFKWDKTPIKYSIFNCGYKQENRIKWGTELIESTTNHSFFSFIKDTKSQLNFYCIPDELPRFKEYEYTLDRLENGLPAAYPEFIYEDKAKTKIKEINIYLYSIGEISEDYKCGGIEVHEILHGLGLVYHSGVWMEQNIRLCSQNGMRVLDRESIARIKELYDLE